MGLVIYTSVVNTATRGTGTTRYVKYSQHLALLHQQHIRGDPVLSFGGSLVDGNQEPTDCDPEVKTAPAI